MTGLRIHVEGTVQGVGFRPFVYKLAHDTGVLGRVRNDSQGVLIEAFGSPEALDLFLDGLGSPPPAAELRSVRLENIATEDTSAFVIETSREKGARQVSIPPDLASCPDCLREVHDVHDRRYRYAFTNCTRCGPRFTIARDVPYDRATTTMASFAMCEACRREYEDPGDRRFHAQPVACPACGPRLWLRDAAGEEWPGDPLEEAAERLRVGRIVAVKGLGGYHLACDATSPRAVARLRRRKHRDEKPFAVMVGTLDEARALARVDGPEARLLTSVERPIVLLERRARSPLAAEVAPGSSLVGLMLAYTPLHELLLAAVGRPLVMTSGNLSDEPMAYRDDEARERLARIADSFLSHDRPIENRCDDSVARIVAGAPVVLRRSRGYVPRSLPLRRPVLRPILACGGQLKNSFCLAAGERAFFGPHIGDLDSLEACRSFEESVLRMQRFLDIEPEVIAHDLHPDYFTTGYAAARPEPIKVGVQHHHAHVASAMVEQGLDGPVLGVAYDGTGYGDDHTAWGGELLLVRPERFERLATFRPLRLPGGEQAIHEVWRLSLSALVDAYDGAPPVAGLARFERLDARQQAGVLQMLRRGFHAPLAHGVGRYFDAIGALVLGRRCSSYEGQVALLFNLAADPSEKQAYPYSIQEGDPLQLDLRPMVRAVVADLAAGSQAGLISARFHNTLSDATAALVRKVVERVGPHPVLLTGGCFQNAMLAEGVLERLGSSFDVRLHHAVPPGDGGLALGQVLVADARLRS